MEQQAVKKSGKDLSVKQVRDPDAPNPREEPWLTCTTMLFKDLELNIGDLINKYNNQKNQIIIGKQTTGDLLEFKEVGKETHNLSLYKIIKIIKEQKAKN